MQPTVTNYSAGALGEFVESLVVKVNQENGVIMQQDK
jgi:hypothetical protein